MRFAVTVHAQHRREYEVKNAANRDICPADLLYAPLFIGVAVGVTALGNGMQEGGK